MSPLKRSNNIAARMGRWSASHWKTAVFGWLAFVVVAFGIATQLPMKTISTQDQNVGQAHRADEIFKKSGFKQTDSQTEFVLIQSKTLTVKSSAFRAAIADVASTVTPFKAIKNFRSPLDPAHGDQVSADGHTAPPRDSKSEVVVMVVGDTRGDYPRWGRILEKAHALGAPDLILFSGDAVLLGTQQFEWNDWFQQAEPILRSTQGVYIYQEKAMQYINANAYSGTKVKMIVNLFYPGYDADNTSSSCKDATTGQPVNLQNTFFPSLARSNWRAAAMGVR